jgi:hypothetical protein
VTERATVPECFLARLRALKVPAGDASSLSLRVRYLPELPKGMYASALPGGGCALTLTPAP